MNTMNNKKKYIQECLPFVLTVLIVLCDQIVKSYIVKRWPRPGTFIVDVFKNDILYFYHVRNKVIAFSLGEGLPETVRPFIFILLPAAVLVFLCVYYFKSSDCTRLQRWAIAGIAGGGIGNLIDRIFRPDGVVDFISVKFFGIFGFERWPTFNISDSAVVVSVIIWFISVVFQGIDAAKAAKLTVE